jgi:osmotically-inducible protein OsmY
MAFDSKPVALAAATLVALLLAACERPGSRAAGGPLTDIGDRGAAQRALGESASVSPAGTAPTGTSRTDPLSREALSDPAITSKVRAALLADPGMAGADVSVNTDRGVVSLTGTVKSQEQTAIASAHAQRQDGVMRIDNHLAMNAQ